MVSAGGFDLIELDKLMFREFLEFAPVGIWKLDEYFRIIEVNPAGLAQANKTKAELLNRDMFGCVPEDLRNQVKTALLSGQPFRHDSYKITFDCQPAITYWDWAAWPIWNGAGMAKGAIVITLDVTERVKLAQQRDDFMATLAHDLKTPLVGAERALELLVEGALGKLAPAQEKIIALLRTNNRSLLDTVQNLLEVYRFETSSAQLSLSEVDLTQLITACVAEMTPLAQSNQLTVEVDIDENLALITADAQAIRRLIINLLDNSLKYVPAGGYIMVKARNVDAKIEIKVIDSGIGIPVDDQQKLFTRFWQGSAGRQYPASTGLGLYLCRQIAEAHSGEIICESSSGAGTTFSITLPISQAVNPDHN